MSSDLRDQLQGVLGDRFRLVAELGGGGMAHVFAATDIKTEERVAIKVLSPDLAAGVDRERFRREIRVALKLKHPNIVPVLDVRESGELLYYTMPLIDGESLRALLAAEPQLAYERVVRIASDVAEALTYAHAQNIVHRDVKPGNILIDRTGRAVVTDFGIARAIEQSVDLASLTSTGLTLGTPTYMSPEQSVGDRFVDGRSDIYSLGCVVYEMLAGEPPFTGPNPQAIIARHLHERPHPLRVVRPDVPRSLEAALEKALEKTPAARFHSAGAFVRALDTPAAEAGGTPRPRRHSRRVTLTGTAIAVVALAVAVTLSRPLGRHNASRNAALDPRRIAVLDFEDHSADHSLGHLASGLALSLNRELSVASAIRVVSHNSVRTLRERGIAVDSLVRLLRLGSVVEGSVERSGEQIRVTVQLVDGATQTQLENATVSRRVGELFMLEDDLAHEVARLLRRRIGEVVRVRETIAGTRNAAAREMVFRADKLREDAAAGASSADTTDVAMAKGKLLEADSLLAAAARADRRWLAPLIDRGWVALELAQRETGDARITAFDRAMTHAAQALARDSTNPLGLELRGSTLYWQAARLDLEDTVFRARLQRARHDLEAAVEKDTSLATAWGTLSLVRVALGTVTEAERDARTALAMDTYLRDAPTILLALYSANLMRDALPEAWTWCDRGAHDYPSDTRFIECRLTLLAEDDTRTPDSRQAWDLVRRADALDPPARARAVGRPWLPLYRRMMAAVVSARAGAPDSARAVARRVRALTLGNSSLATDLDYEDAYLHLVLGEREEALRLLARYLEARPSLADLVSRHPRWRVLRDDSTFVRLTTGGQRSPK